jgi:hypothetical protein
MEDAIQKIRKETRCKIVVGGAVLTESYALSIGADFMQRMQKQPWISLRACSGKSFSVNRYLGKKILWLFCCVSSCVQRKNNTTTNHPFKISNR